MFVFPDAKRGTCSFDAAEKICVLHQSTLIATLPGLNGSRARQRKFSKKADVKVLEHRGAVSAASLLVLGAGQLIAWN